MLRKYIKNTYTMKVLILVLGVLLAIGCSWKNKSVSTAMLSTAKSIHSLSAVNLLDGDDVSMGKYKGKVMLVVNTASKCGLTPQYKKLQALHEKYGDQGLAVLGFPANNFMNQEPGDADKIATFCSKNYGVTFDMYDKVSVKGSNKHPIYTFLTEKAENGVMDSSVKWNFQKYLLDKEGRLIAMFNPKSDVLGDEVIQKIEALLKE